MRDEVLIYKDTAKNTTYPWSGAVVAADTVAPKNSEEYKKRIKDFASKTGYWMRGTCYEEDDLHPGAHPDAQRHVDEPAVLLGALHCAPGPGRKHRRARDLGGSDVAPLHLFRQRGKGHVCNVNPD